MKLLVITQTMNTQDPVLGFFTRWVEELAVQVDSLNVICLNEGEHVVPSNVRVHSLGKENGVGKLIYVWRFYSLIWSLRAEYDAIFVHMNQEYILLGGLLWKSMGKRIYMWRNHRAGSWLTRLAVAYCNTVFCTSKHSFTSQFKKTILMPVGVDLARFFPEEAGGSTRERRSVLFLSRIGPVKRPEMLIDALGIVLSHGISFTASIIGAPLEKDRSYYDSLKVRAESLGLHNRLRFLPSIQNSEAPAVYRKHDIFVNCSASGAYDKTIFEAAACGCRVIAASDDFHDAAGDSAYAPDTQTLAERLISALEADQDTVERARIHMQSVARNESLSTLIDRLLLELST